MAQRRRLPSELHLKARRGSMLLEVVVGAGMLAALLVVVNQLATKLNAHAAMLDREFVAQQTVENLLEEFTARPWSELSPEEITNLEVPEWVREKLSNVTCTGEVSEQVFPIVARRILLRLKWDAARSAAQRQVQLVTWVFPAEGTTDE